MRLARSTAATLCACLGWGCGMTETGEVWTTKSQSVTAPPAALALHGSAGDPAGLRAEAVNLLEQAIDSPTAILRANAIEGMKHHPVLLEVFVRRGLVDDNRGVRFVAAMTIGEHRMDDLAHLLEPLQRDESESVQAAAIYGMQRCGLNPDLTPLASMIVSNDPEVRGNAALVIGELGNPTAAPMVRAAVGRGMERVSASRNKMVDLQLAEALVKLGDEREIEVIRAALFAPAEEGELTALACMMCGRLHDERAAANLVRLAVREGRFQQPAEVRMAATWALARLGTGQAALEVPMENVTAEMSPLRAQAALTQGEIRAAAAVTTLSEMLRDPNPMVQVAAASAILQILGS